MNCLNAIRLHAGTCSSHCPPREQITYTYIYIYIYVCAYTYIYIYIYIYVYGAPKTFPVAESLRHPLLKEALSFLARRFSGAGSGNIGGGGNTILFFMMYFLSPPQYVLHRCRQHFVTGVLRNVTAGMQSAPHLSTHSSDVRTTESNRVGLRSRSVFRRYRFQKSSKILSG